jgi:hypothetical protein
VKLEILKLECGEFEKCGEFLTFLEYWEWAGTSTQMWRILDILGILGVGRHKHSRELQVLSCAAPIIFCSVAGQALALSEYT